jgi:hypothetical protein
MTGLIPPQGVIPVTSGTAVLPRDLPENARHDGSGMTP